MAPTSVEDNQSPLQKKKARARAVFKRLQGGDKQRVHAGVSHGGKTFEKSVKDVAGKPGSHTTEPAGKDLGVFSSGKGRIRRGK